MDSQLASIVKAAGTRTLKNIATDFEVFSVKTHAGASTPAELITADTPKAPEHTKPCLAILPFDNLNKSDDSSFLTDGILKTSPLNLRWCDNFQLSHDNPVSILDQVVQISGILIEQFNVD